MPPSFDAANARHRFLTERMDADVPELVLMLLQGIRESQDAEGEADESSHPLRALLSPSGSPGNTQGIPSGNPQTRAQTMALSTTCPATLGTSGAPASTPVEDADMSDDTEPVKTSAVT